MYTRHLSRFFLLLSLAVITSIHSADAFTVLQESPTRQRSLTLNAWSLDLPDPRWYNTVKNPTARRTIYDDAPSEFRFVNTGSDWPSAGEAETVILLNDAKQGVQMNPFRRAVQWISRRKQR